ncbi:MAG TPA: prepilin-type N-terminal cleavage/methylation domain-containing protein [Armatimonadota bacterium]|jgi:prepilin-type N-terminal cleavage/methylation domain-containing protein
MDAWSRRRHGGFTIVEILVVVAIIAILAAIIFPVFSRATEKSRQSTCLSNQRQLSISIMLYAHDYGVFPDIDWSDAVTGNGKIKTCPSKPDQQLGYGMNSYLHGLRLDTLNQYSRIIVTADSPDSSCAYGDFTRHGKTGCIFSRLDGSVILAFPADPARAGRFACGDFPVIPRVVSNGVDFIDRPRTFLKPYNNGAQVTDEFLIAGPYGQNAADTWNWDLANEDILLKLRADASPAAGDAAPGADDIYPPSTQDQLPVNITDATKPIRQFTQWTAIPFAAPNNYTLQGSANYNCKFYGRTTYAVTYVYSEDEQDITLDWWCDDVGKIWLNGALLKEETDKGQLPLNGDPTTWNIPVKIPKGISYLVIKTTNNLDSGGNTAGGMKFKIRVNNLTYPLYFSPHLP